jgi:hypothetical protein
LPIAAVVADANALLSAVIGKAALRVFTEHHLEVHSARFNAKKPSMTPPKWAAQADPLASWGERRASPQNADEVAEYLPHLANKYRLPLDLLQLQWRLLPVRLHPEPDYAAHLPQAQADLAARDPDDAHPLALARALNLPLWSNDRDLEGHGVECWPTARLLKALEG